MGAFSSNDRMDFRAVLSAFTNTEISMPASGRWANAGMVRGGMPRSRMAAPGRPTLGKAPSGPTPARLSCGRLWKGGVLPQYCLSPAQCSHLLRLAQRAGCPPAEIEALFLKQGGAYRHQTLSRVPYAGSRQGGETNSVPKQLRFPTDPFPTLLAGTVTPFAFGTRTIRRAAVFVSLRNGM